MAYGRGVGLGYPEGQYLDTRQGQAVYLDKLGLTSARKVGILRQSLTKGPQLGTGYPAGSLADQQFT